MAPLYKVWNSIKVTFEFQKHQQWAGEQFKMWGGIRVGLQQNLIVFLLQLRFNSFKIKTDACSLTRVPGLELLQFCFHFFPFVLNIVRYKALISLIYLMRRWNMTMPLLHYSWEACFFLSDTRKLTNISVLFVSVRPLETPRQPITTTPVALVNLSRLITWRVE